MDIEQFFTQIYVDQICDCDLSMFEAGTAEVVGEVVSYLTL